jgi:hypothetical protein
MIPAVFGALGRLDRNRTLTPDGIFFMRMTLVAIWIAHFWYKVGYRGMPAGGGDRDAGLRGLCSCAMSVAADHSCPGDDGVDSKGVLYQPASLLLR